MPGPHKDEDLERGEALMDRLARQRGELEARRRGGGAEPLAPPGSAPAPPTRDGRPNLQPPSPPPLSPPPQAAEAPPRRTPLGPPGNPPRTRTPFKNAPRPEAPQAPTEPEASAPAPSPAWDPAPAPRSVPPPPPEAPAWPSAASSYQTPPQAARSGLERPAPRSFETPNFPPEPAPPPAAFSAPEPQTPSDPFADFDSAPPPRAQTESSWTRPTTGDGWEEEGEASRRPAFRGEPRQEPAEAEPFALERRPLRVPKAESRSIFPEEEEEEAEAEALDLTDRVPLTEDARTRPFSAFEWSVAARYLRARRKDGFISAISWLSLVGIALGVAALIVVMAVMTGFRHEMVNQILGVNAHATISPQLTDQRRPFANYDAMATRLAADPGVIQAAPVIHGQVMASNPNAQASPAMAVVRGVRLEDFRRMKAAANPETREGTLELFHEDRGVAVGSRLAFMLGLRVGDRITLTSPDGDLTPFGTTLRTKSYPIAYVFKLGMSELDAALLYMPLEEAQIFFNKEKAVDVVEVMVRDPQNVAQMEPGFLRAAGEPVTIFTWNNSNGSYIAALDMERRVMRVILSLIILIAAFNIISGLIMLVKEKGRDVAILRTIGASRGAIMRIFFLCGAAIGVIGTLLGVALGVLIALNISQIQSFVENLFGAKVFPDDIYFLSQLPSRLQWSDVATTALIALGVSFLATIFPARRAARLDPVEALRYE